ncbi:MAG: DNA topoisomerase (ATP-hydrolyzing) [Eubacteriales bacterium]|nr:DNA topoisomerase (ATP-hydrolyzing) [Eubacteriales bacterium]
MPREKKHEPPKGEVILQRSMESVMHDSMIPYSEFVILERALPRVEDGLKPVQRRILYTMMELGITPDKPHKKCARITGDCMGKYHPHGDTSVYDALARMAQDFVMRGRLVDGHGNFGSIDGDSPAAMRYTEARLAPLALELLRDIEKDTVSFRLNFDDTRKEPDMLPGAFPNLLVNGASGIAVGLATNIPPHNLGETIDATIAQIKNPDITTAELMQHLPAPDFPTGGQLIHDREELFQAYETGRARLQVRAKAHVEPGSAGRSLIVITEMPYQVNKAAMLEKILKLSEEKKALFSGIYDIRDESDRTGLRAVIELRKDADVEKTLAALYRYSDMQVTFGVNLVAIAGGKPVQMGLKAALGHFIRHRKNVVTRRTRFDLEQAEARAHILEGLIVAVDNLDAIIKLIRASKTPKEARAGLVAQFALTEIQAQAILDMRLQRLTGLEILTLREEYAQLQKKIAKLQAILKSEKKLMNLICEELEEVKEQFADPRRTELIAPPSAKETVAAMDEGPEPEETTVYETQAGFFKRMAPKTAEKAIEEEALPPARVLRTMTNHRLLMLTSRGNAFVIAAEQVPECRPKERGLAPAGMLAGLEKDEQIVQVIEAVPGKYEGTLLFVTKNGLIKASDFAEYDVRTRKFVALKLREGDELAAAFLQGEEKELLLVSRGGMAIRFAAEEVPVTGRATAGVKGMAIAQGDALLAAIPYREEGELLLASDSGHMKRCIMADFEPQARGGKGVKCVTFLKNGANGTGLVCALPVREPFDFFAVQKMTPPTRLHTDMIDIELRSGKGAPVLMAIAGDDLEKIVPIG